MLQLLQCEADQRLATLHVQFACHYLSKRRHGALAVAVLPDDP